MSDVEVIYGDCLTVMRDMAAGSVDAVVTDPPYGVDYKAWDGEIPPQTFLDECLRVSTGPVVWFGAAVTRCLFQFAGYDPPPDRMLVWAPSFTLRKSHKNSIYYRFHPIWCWRLPVGQKAVHSDVLTHPCAGRNWWDHPATKPKSLMIDLVKMTSEQNSLILDPFAGSGTTAVACLKTGRRCVAIESDPKYIGVIKRRVEEASTPLFASEGVGL